MWKNVRLVGAWIFLVVGIIVFFAPQWLDRTIDRPLLMSGLGLLVIAASVISGFRVRNQFYEVGSPYLVLLTLLAIFQFVVGLLFYFETPSVLNSFLGIKGAPGPGYDGGLFDYHRNVGFGPLLFLTALALFSWKHVSKPTGLLGKLKVVRNGPGQHAGG